MILSRGLRVKFFITFYTKFLLQKAAFITNEFTNSDKAIGANVIRIYVIEVIIFLIFLLIIVIRIIRLKY